MSSSTQQKFDELVKEAYWDALRPLGFRKKANNFYIFNSEIGKFINIQKSIYGTKDDIKFKIYIGIFSPEYWQAQFNYHDEAVPGFPTEPECIIRNRIGALLRQDDTWYDLTDASDLTALKEGQRRQLNNIILPYLATINTNDDLIHALDNNRMSQFILLAVLKRTDAARTAMQALLNSNPSPNQKRIIMEKAGTYGLI